MKVAAPVICSKDIEDKRFLKSLRYNRPCLLLEAIDSPRDRAQRVQSDRYHAIGEVANS